ncbi:ribosome quality control complex subunit TCF25 isoform X2 [Centruroides vittatus]|uniref:ribosome quality control complex subunit TCF25 isoform X2 n=1 Tax=Centruroides vittatus TaxID=120091 RepID=UPI003510AA24
MSNRVLRKLHGDKDIVASLGVEGMSESDDGGSQASGIVKKQLAANRFELLNSVEHSLSDTEAKEDDDRENEVSQEQDKNKLEKQDSIHSTDSLKRKKKKKKKKIKSQRSTEDNLDDAEDEVEASVREVNKILGEPENIAVSNSASASPLEQSPFLQKLLNVDHRNLNPDNEMKKIFGSKVIQNEQSKRRGRGRGHVRSTVLVTPRNWPHVGKPGISMNLLETKGDTYFFTFEHSKQYQSVQHQFLDAVESFNPDNIVALLNMHPYHIDALIQFSDICKMGEDFQMAAELTERALYCFECCFHPLFNVSQGNCRLDYRRAENRSFYIALFKHLSFVGQRGCNKTALEFCKVILGLDPMEDPLCVILMIDYYALRSAHYDFLIRMYHEWEAERNLSQLPNFAFSVPLAIFLQSSQDKLCEQANTMLQNSLIMFPGLLMPLLDKCGIQPDPYVSSHPFFGSKSQTNQSAALSQLIALYIGRCYLIWKDQEIMSWLENNVQEVLQRVEDKDPYVADCEEKRKIRYKSTPRNVVRHIILSNIKEASVTLPQDLTHTPIFGFDPLPPTDAISSYSRSPRSSMADDQGVLSMFFRSLLPNFNLPREGAVADAAPANRESGAAGGDRNSDTNDLRRSVTSLLDAMRDLLSNIHLVDVPNEGDVDSSDDEHED